MEICDADPTDGGRRASIGLERLCQQTPEPAVGFAPDCNFSQPKTIGFYAMSDKVTGNNPTELTGFQRNRIDSALQSALEAKGFEFVT